MWVPVCCVLVWSTGLSITPLFSYFFCSPTLFNTPHELSLKRLIRFSDVQNKIQYIDLWYEMYCVHRCRYTAPVIIISGWHFVSATRSNRKRQMGSTGYQYVSIALGMAVRGEDARSPMFIHHSSSRLDIFVHASPGANGYVILQTGAVPVLIFAVCHSTIYFMSHWVNDNSHFAVLRRQYCAGGDFFTNNVVISAGSCLYTRPLPNARLSVRRLTRSPSAGRDDDVFFPPRRPDKTMQGALCCIYL